MRMDFATQDYFRDPIATVEKLRAAGPIHDDDTGIGRARLDG